MDTAAFDFERGLEQAAAAVLGDRLRDLPQQRGARIAVGINGVTEARWQAMFASERRQAFVNARAVFELGEHRLDSIARAAVNRAAQRTQCREHGREEVGAGARDDARGEGRGVELVFGACDQHAVERFDFPFGGGRAGDPSEQASRHAAAAGRSWSGRLRERERELADDELGAIDSCARRLTAIPRGEARHHGFEPQQRRRVITDGGERVGDRSGHLRAVNLGTQRGDFFGDGPLATPQQEANLLERRVRNDFLDRITAIRELALVDRADRRLGHDDAGRAVVDTLGLRDRYPRRCGRQAASAAAALVGDDAAQRFDIGAAIERLAADLAPITFQPAAADVGVERAELDAELVGRLARGHHAGAFEIGAFEIASGHHENHAMRGGRRQVVSIQLASR